MTEYIDYKSLDAKIRERWQHSYNLNTDQKFVVPGLAEIRDVCTGTRVQLMKHKSYIAECDDFAIVLWGEVKKARISADLPPPEQFSWSIGLCLGTQFKGWADTHWQNIAYTRSGLYLIEPQTMEIWKPTSADVVLLTII